MNVSRRGFLKYCMGSAAALGLNVTVLGRLEKALAAGGDAPVVIWLNGANCTGCTVSLANLFSNDGPGDVADLLLNYINLSFHPNLMGAAGSLALEQLAGAAQGSFILAVEGGIPTAFGGRTCMVATYGGTEYTAMETVQTLGKRASAILAIGTCASFGGVPSGNPNPTGIVSVQQAVGRSVINIPGCPIHPDWVVGAIAQLLAGATPDLDSDGRPRTFFSREIHDRCPREDSDEAHTFGMDGRCLKELGCKGEKTHADCYSRYWNSGANWCIGANAICIGCTENGFPDSFSPFYKETGGENNDDHDDDHDDDDDDDGHNGRPGGRGDDD